VLIKLYQEKYKEQLASLLCIYFKETALLEYTGNIQIANSFIDKYIQNGNYIYLVVDKEDNITGFVFMYINNLYGFSKNYLVIDHMYIKQKFRGGKTTKLLFIMIGKVMKDLELDAVGTIYLNSSNKDNITKFDYKDIATVVTVKKDSIGKQYKKYTKGLK